MASALGYHATDPERSPRLCFHLKPGSYDTTALIEVLKELKAFYHEEPVVLVWDGLSGPAAGPTRTHRPRTPPTQDESRRLVACPHSQHAPGQRERKDLTESY